MSGSGVIALLAVLVAVVAGALRVRVRLGEPELTPSRAVLFGCLDGLALALVSFWAMGFLYLVVSAVF